MFRFYRKIFLEVKFMVEWNINHRMMADKVNSSISNYDFEGLAKWFNGLDENTKADFKTACRDCKLDYYDFAELISTYYEQNPDIVFAPNHYRKLIDWLFEKAWYCDAVTVHKTSVVADLIGLILFYKIMNSKDEEKQDIYLIQYISILEPMITNYLKYGLFDKAWDLAVSCYFKIADRNGRFTPWRRIFICHLAKIGRLRGKYEISLTPEMEEVALQGVKWFSYLRTKRDLATWKKLQK